MLFRSLRVRITRTADHAYAFELQANDEQAAQGLLEIVQDVH